MKHGHTSQRVSPTYTSWQRMKDRCTNPNNIVYHRYGAIGVTYDPRWEDFSAFLSDMGERPEGCTLDREYNDKPYCKSNCRWATPQQQSNNRKSNKILEFEGESKTVAEWARHLGVSRFTLYNRIKLGWTPEEVLSFPKYRHRRA